MPLTSDDKIAIMELTARYNHTLNHYQAEEWADLFTEDGVVEAGDIRRMAGRAALVEYVKRSQASKRERRNFTSMPIIEGDGEYATLKMYVFALTVTGGIQIAVMGEYDDKLAKVNGEWKFKHRKVTLYPQTGFEP